MNLSLKALVATAVVSMSLVGVSRAQDDRPLPVASPTPAPAPAPAADTDTKPSERGGFFIEPGISYELGDVKAKTATVVPGITDDSTGEANGLGVLARVGFHINDTIFVAADGRYSFLKQELSLYDGKTDAKAWQLAPVVGIQTPIAGVRAWAGYIAAAELDPDGANGWDIKYEKGQGWLVGAGLRVKAFSINLEYKNIQYDRMVAQNNPGPAIGDTDIEGEDRAWVASVSFPFAL
jgi:hypothetical protein